MIAINCKTERQAEKLISFFGELFDKDYGDNNWEDYKEKTCYNIENSHSGWAYSDKSWYKKHKYIVITFDEFVQNIHNSLK